ncbi:MAG TPA: UDP-N-acetylmuramoyl-tripeptide--D-alanyl-D-alanine ligase [Vicinamibacterales bacterium]|nr:UDP-N-acetylmuramoyl-tripeptide--D-alanyl-D-alanine ligase [Vicinamibacterales bacterium]
MRELTLTLDWVAAAVGATRRKGSADAPVGNVVTDSRTLQPGDLFVALRGPRFDGHAFVGDVLARGAVGAIVERERVQEDSRTIEVPDTLDALQRLAQRVRSAVSTRVIAITGSAGKTTTKEAIAAVLATRFRVVKNKGNLNNHIGLPLSLMQLRTAPDVAVMELGMNHAGEISRLVEIATPDMRVWTNVGDAHLGFFASADAIADAKAEILEGAGADTVLVCNADDRRVMARVRTFPGRVLTFGEADGATIRARSIRDRGIRGMSADIETPAGDRTIETALLGRGNLLNVLAATAVAVDSGIGLDQIAVEVSRLQPADRRGAVRQLRDGITLIDDSYNSSPSALTRALEVVAHEARDTHAIGVLGEMLELGEHSLALHESCGRAAAAASLSRLFAIGGAPARALAAAAIAAGMPAASVSYFETSEQAAPAVVTAVTAGDLVLVKGSRGTRTDVVADRLVAELG